MAIDTIWVFAQSTDGTPTTGTLELLTKARSLGAGTLAAFHGGADGDAIAASLGAQQPTTHLSGTVLATWSGEPYAGVQVTVSGREQATDATGRFDFPAVASGRAKLQVTYAGHPGAARDIVLPAGKSLQVEVLMDSAATDLAPYIADASRLESQIGLPGFYARRRLGFGRFFSRADIERTHDHLVTQLLSVAGASYRCGTAGCAPVLFRYGRECLMTLLIDGYSAPQQIPRLATDSATAFRSGCDT